MGTHNAHGPRPTCARFASPEAGQRPELYRMRNPPFPPLIYHKDCPNLLTHECERPAEGPKSEVVLSILRAHHQESNHVHFRTHTPTRHHPRANGPRAPGRNRRARPTKTEGANYAASAQGRLPRHKPRLARWQSHRHHISVMAMTDIPTICTARTCFF